MTDYTVIRSRRRTLALEVTRQGTALVRAPLRAADEDIARFVDSHRQWLEKHLAARQDRGYVAHEPCTPLLPRCLLQPVNDIPVLYLIGGILPHISG